MNKMFIVKRCKKCLYSVFLAANKIPDTCGLTALSLKETKICKKAYGRQRENKSRD